MNAITQHGPDIKEIIRDARRSIATAKLDELEFQSYRLAGLAAIDMLSQHQAVDELWDMALANGLVDIHGIGLIQQIIGDAFGTGGEDEPS